MSNSPTVLSHLHTLLTTLRQQAPLPHAPFLHPYAPAGKGKGKEDGRDVSRLFRELRDGIEGVRVILGGDVQSRPADGERERERARLGRVMKELSTHQAALLPLLSSLGNLPTPATSAVPFAVSAQSPTELLLNLGASVTLDCFSEPSQFGMQGDSLVLAGKSIVIDITLESAQLDADTPSSSRVQEGTIKLVKVSVSHATADGETKTSDRIQEILQARIEAILHVWNGESFEEVETRDLRLARAVSSLKNELEDIVLLDGLTAEGARDWLSDVDAMHHGLEQLIAISNDSSSFRLYAPVTSAVLPAFHLLPLEYVSPLCQLRPVSTAQSPFDSLEDPQTINLDGSTTTAWSGWSLDISPGVVVSASFFPSPIEESQRTFLPISETFAIEDLMCTSPDVFVSPMPIGSHNMPLPFATFPISDSDNVFLHASERPQLWSLASDRGEAYVVGRFGVGSWGAVAALAQALTPAVVLEKLFRSVFNPIARAAAAARNEGDDASEAGSEELDAFLRDDGVADLPVSVSLVQNAMALSFPLGPTTHAIELETLAVPPFVRAPDGTDVLVLGLVELVAAISGNVNHNSGEPSHASAKRKRSDASADEPEKKARMVE